MAPSLAAPLRSPRRVRVRSRAGEWTRDGASFVWRRRRLRNTLAACAVALGLLAGGWTWLRGSSLVAIRQVHVSGAHGADARQIDVALTEAARRMSTLDVSAGPLLAAVASLRVVRDVRLRTSFPHGLQITVIERPPVAAMTVGGQRTAVAADGTVLGPALLSGSLPRVDAGAALAGNGRLQGATALGAVAVLGALPAPLARAGVVTRVYVGPRGLTVAMRNGLQVYFGDGSRPHAKWLSLARVLADPSSGGATYVDVRLPERPAAGVVTASGALAAGASTTAQVSASDPTAAALAASLASAVSGGPAATTAAATSAPTPAATPAATTTAPTPAPTPAATTTAATPAPTTPTGAAGAAAPVESQAPGG